MADLTIRSLIDRVYGGDIRIPAFQRDFVWNPEQVAFLVDSVYKGFPIGTIVFWQTDERLKTEKNLGSFTLPDPKRDYPVNYVLDGQQRITSLFSVFQTELEPDDNSWIDIFLDMEVAKDPQDSCFFALDPSEVDPKRHFPIKAFFDTVSYRKATKNLDDKQAEFVDQVQARFKEYRIQNQTFETADRNEVAIVFERINRAGTELNLFELLSAWSWSEEFDLIEKFSDLQVDIEAHGFADLVDDRDLQLRTCAAVITGETSPNKILDLKGEDIRKRFNEIETGILGAIDFLKREIGIAHYKMLPFPGALVPLSCFFATEKADGQAYVDAQRDELKKWFWRSTLSRRFSSDVTARQAADIKEMHLLRNSKDYKFKFPTFELKIDFLKNRFSSSTGNSKALILMLANLGPKSFLSGANIDPVSVLKKGSKHEFHHIFPKKFLENQGIGLREANSLANICFLTRSDNNKIKADDPKKYFDEIPKSKVDEYLRLSLVEYEDRNLTFEEFVERRSKALSALAIKLAN